MASKKQEVESVIAFIFMQKLLTNPRATLAFDLGLIDANNNIIKEPETEEEIDSLTDLDYIILKLKRMLGSRISQFAKLYYLKNYKRQFQERIITNNIEKHSIVQRLSREVKLLTEKYDMDFDDILKTLIEIDIQEAENETDNS